MAKKKLAKPDLGVQIEQLSKNLELFTGKVEQFCGLLVMVQKKVQGVEDFLGRVVFPVEALGDLTGELRALRHLWDTEGKFKFMDKPKSVANGIGSTKP